MRMTGEGGEIFFFKENNFEIQPANLHIGQSDHVVPNVVNAGSDVIRSFSCLQPPANISFLG